MNNIYNIVSDMDIANGVTKRTNCPNCGSYNTFTVTNNMGSLVWNCYKASCNVKGGTRVHLSVDDIRTGFNGAKEFAEDSFVLPEYIIPYELESFYGIDNKHLLLDVKENRVVFPIVHNGVIVDATGRSLGKRLPKWKRYGKSNLPYTFGCGKVAVVVEDCVSATLVGDDVLVGVAVLGTSLSESHKEYLSQFSTTIIALDPDALPKTLSFAKELRGHVDNVKVLKLKDDLKYLNKEDIDKLKCFTI
tara:strand:+ start:2236 stop:2976 length:741 start_codon:yes stop_codon:yes gene_type:complete